MDRLTQKALSAIEKTPDYEVFGRVTKVLGLLVEIAGFGQNLSIGSIVHLRPSEDKNIPCEVAVYYEAESVFPLVSKDPSHQ